ncbi:MAG: protocatechuate 3,4-dioxygenase, partial [Novosphingobium sp. 17-62-9]
MAKIIGGYFTSHVPGIGGAIVRGDQETPYWKPFFAGFPPIREWLAEAKPDVAVVFSNDHGLNFFLDTMPTFAVGAAPQYDDADEGWGLPVYKSFEGHPALSWHVIDALVRDEFDITTCQKMLVDHAVSIPFELVYPGVESWPIKLVPIS